MVKAELLTPDDAASYLGVSRELLAKWRHYGRGPAHIKLSSKVVRYRQADLELWLEALRVKARQ